MKSIVFFILLFLVSGLLIAADAALKVTPNGYDYFKVRDGLSNCRAKFITEKKGRVAFMGGSITEMGISLTEGGSWRDIVMNDLKKRFPDTAFDFISAGIGSMGSTPHSFRFNRDILKNGPVDLLFIEAAVNDEGNGMSPKEMVRGMEGVVRHARLSNPNIDIIMMHFVDPSKMKVINEGKVPVVIEQHEKVAEYYSVPSINMALEVTERIKAGEFDWHKDFKDLHPSSFGHAIYGRSIIRLFDQAWKEASAPKASLKACRCPDIPLDEKSYFKGKMVDLSSAVLSEGWQLVPDWKPEGNVSTRKGFVNVPALVSEKPGSILRLKFEGTAVGIFVAAGPDAGIIEYSIDGQPFESRNLFTNWSRQLHLPWAQILDGDLSMGSHELTLKVAEKSDPKSKGTAVRIMHLLVN
ncbi:MAG: SGNH/GDSL hydrolase family protein [bacterium]